MANLKEVRTRIQSIKSTRQITSAMKMVSASKLHKSQASVYPLRAYTNCLRSILHDAMHQLPARSHPFVDERNDMTQVLVVVIAANKGLCGNYNEMILKRAHQHITLLASQGYDTRLLLIGKKSEAYFRKLSYNLFAMNHDVIDHISLKGVKSLGREISEAYRKESFGRVDVVYNRFINAVNQTLVIEQILPLRFQDKDSSAPEKLVLHEKQAESEQAARRNDAVKFIIEPTATEAVDTMIPYFFNYNLYRIMLNASASEHGARMTAMHKATDNADELLKSLTITYNKVRQAMITREIMEIVGGSEE